jgi:bifunctional DNA-binding transcriptional regulator/antitoxin component of YhaV-PrlF toxin-antitoxin module
MVCRTLLQDQNKRTFLCIPAFLRDKFNLEKGGAVDIDCNNEQIIITPLREIENTE